MWTLTNKIFYLCYCIFGKWLPESRRLKLGKTIRCFFARRILKKSGKNLNVEKGAYFTPGVSIGDYSGIGVNSELVAVGNDGAGEIIIGNYVMMGPECVIYTSSHKTERTDVPMGLQGDISPKSVVIGNDVWIGRRVIIMPGVTIGDGCIIGAGAVVTKSVPPYSVAVGVPAKVVKARK